jgi:ankyrin repeat protein
LLSTTIIALILPLSWKLSRNHGGRDNNYFALNGGGFGKKENNVISSDSQNESRADRRQLQVKQRKRNPKKVAAIDLLSLELHEAINLNQVDIVSDIIRKADLIENGVVVNQETGMKTPHLHHAIFDGRIDIAQVLLRNNALVNQPAPDGSSPLHYAAFGGHIDIVEALLSRNASLDQRDNFGYSPLHVAVSRDRIDIVNMLLRKNASIDQPNNKGESPLHIASHNGYLDIINTLLSRNASLDQRDNFGCSPLHVAVSYDRIDIVNMLLRKNASVDQLDNSGNSPLHDAAYYGHIGIVTALLKNSASVNVINNYNVFGYTPLKCATSLATVKSASATAVLRLNMVAFELLKNKASMTKLDVGILSKFAIQNSEMGNSSYLEILWGSAELRNSKKVEELRSFEFTEADLKKHYKNDEYEFSMGNDEALGADKFIGLSPIVELRNSTLEGKDWNWHHVLLDSSYDSDTNQRMTALLDNERVESELLAESSIPNGSETLFEIAEIVENQEFLRDQDLNLYEDSIESSGDVMNQEIPEDLHPFQRIYAELIFLLDKKDLLSISWARMYQDSSVVVNADDEKDRDLMIQSAMIAQLAAKGSIQGEREVDMIEEWDSDVDFDRYMTMEEQTIASQRRVDTLEFTLETLKWRDRADKR